MDENEYKTCPYCAEHIKIQAIKCRHCHEMLPDTNQSFNNEDSNRKEADNIREAKKESGALDSQAIAENEVLLEINLKGLYRTDPIIFKENHLEHKDIIMKYDDVEEIAYNSVSSSLNFVPTNQTYKYFLASNKSKISLNALTHFHIKENEIQEEWVKLIYVSNEIIKPRILHKLYHRLFTEHKEVKIGSLVISSEGIAKKKFFGGTVKAPWNKVIYEPTINQGYVQVLIDNGNQQPLLFDEFLLEEPNAVLIPSLFILCYNQIIENK